MFNNWKIMRMLKKGFQSISVPAKEKILPESAIGQKKEVPVYYYSVQNKTIKNKYRKITAFAKIAVTAVLIVSLLMVMALNLNQQPGNTDASSSNFAAATQNSYESEDIINEFREFYNQFNLKLSLTDEEIADIAKSVKLKDGSTVYDQGISFRCDNYNSKAVIYGKNNISVSYSSAYSKNGAHSETCAIIIGSANSELIFPYGVKYGDSLSDVLTALNITEKFNEALEKLKEDSGAENRYVELFVNNQTNELISLIFKNEDVATSEPSDISITYHKDKKDEAQEGVSINIISGKVSSLNIINSKADKNSTVEIDATKDMTFYYDNSDYYYNKETGVYAKVSSITINNQRAIITYKAYADKNTAAAIDYVVTDNNGIKNHSQIYQDITTEEKEYTVTINDCFEKGIDLRIGNIGYAFQPYEYMIVLKCADNYPTISKEDKLYGEFLSAFRKFYESFGLSAYNLDITEEQLKEKAQAIRFIDNKTLFDHGVYLHYDNYNGKGIVYGKEYNKIGYEKNDRGLEIYLMISEETRNIDYPFNFKIGTSLQDVLEKLHFIDQYKHNENNNIYEDVDGFEVAKTFIICTNDNTNESLQLKYHMDNLTVTNKSLEKGNVTIQYVKESYINYNSLTNSVKFIFKEGKLKYIYVEYDIILDTIIPYDNSKSISFHFENNDYSYSSETGIYAKLKTIEVSKKTLKITFKTKTDADKKCDISVLLLASLDLISGSDYTTIDIQAGEHEYTYSYTVTNGDDNSPLTFDGRIKIGGNQLDFYLYSSSISQNYIE